MEGAGAYPYVYAVGQIEMRFPNLSVEKEFAQVIGRADAAGLTDRQALQGVLAERNNRYLARQVCWVFSVEGIDTYILTPRDPTDYDLLIEAVRPTPRRNDIDVVIGLRGPIAPPEVCNGLTIPVVAFDQIYSFDSDAFITAMGEAIGGLEEGGAEERGARGRGAAKKGRGARERPQGPGPGAQAASEELFNRLLQVSDNAGATDEHRALNYLATRFPDIYRLTSERYGANYSLDEVNVEPSRLSGVRKIVTVVFRYRLRDPAAIGDVSEQYFVRVDVTEEFPFLVSPLQRGFTR